MPHLHAVEAAALQHYAGSHRPLVVFSPSANDPRLAEQRRALAENASGLAERDVAIIEVAGSTVTVRKGPAARLSAEALRRGFGVGRQQFTDILVGKDTGAKLRADAPISASRLFSVIDAMPMRQQEMRR
jgi:hypothetical protein